MCCTLFLLFTIFISILNLTLKIWVISKDISSSIASSLFFDHLFLIIVLCSAYSKIFLKMYWYLCHVHRLVKKPWSLPIKTLESYLHFVIAGIIYLNLESRVLCVFSMIFTSSIVSPFLFIWLVLVWTLLKLSDIDSNACIIQFLNYVFKAWRCTTLRSW